MQISKEQLEEAARGIYDSMVIYECKIRHTETELFGKFSTHLNLVTGWKGMLNVFEIIPIERWTVYYNGVKLNEGGKIDFYEFLKTLDNVKNC